MLFEITPDFDWEPYLPAIFVELIEPRVEKLPSETTTAVSGLLRLCATWAGFDKNTPFLTNYNEQLPRKIAECLFNASDQRDCKEICDLRHTEHSDGPS